MVYRTILKDCRWSNVLSVMSNTAQWCVVGGVMKISAHALVAASLLALTLAACADDDEDSANPLFADAGLQQDAGFVLGSGSGLIDASSGGADAATPLAEAGQETGDASVPASDGSVPEDAAAGGGKLPSVDKIDGLTNGPFAVTIEKNVGPNRGWVFRPTDLGKDGLLHPIFSWGAGAGTNASNYEFHMSQIASHGFVVEAHASTGDGTDHKGAIDWLLEQNGKAGSPYYQKLDPKRIAAGGHSQGSISTFAMADDPRLLTTIHVAGGSFDGNGYSKLRRPTAMICGKSDTLATPNAEVDYQKSTVPTFFTVMDGVDHIQAARQGLGAIIAWLRWQIGGEPERKSMFIGPDCDFCKGKFKSQSKGF